jgi:hypothetical protein
MDGRLLSSMMMLAMAIHENTNLVHVVAGGTGDNCNETTPSRTAVSVC